MKQVAWIEGRLPSLNEYVRACRANRFKAAQMVRDAEEGICWQVGSLRRVARPIYVTFVWQCRDTRRDPDNIAFAKKFIFDALQTMQILPKDSWAWVKGFKDDFVKGDDGVTIILEEIE